MVRFELARPDDVEGLVAAALSAFADEARKYGHYPPGLAALERHLEAMREGVYYKIVAEGRIVGGIMIAGLGEGRYKLDTIYVEAGYQNRGIGAQAMTFIEQAIPAKRWTLKTPATSYQNHHFYEKLGYKKVRVAAPEEYPDDPNVLSFFIYEKEMGLVIGN